MSRLKILILDAGNQNALAITRWLGKTGKYELHHIGFNKLALSFFSRYCKKKYILPRPSETIPYYEALLGIVKTGQYDILFPVGNYSFEVCSKHYSELSKHCRLLVAPEKCFDLAASKIETYKQAQSCAVPIPLGYDFDSREELLKKEIRFPVVVKAPVEMGTNVVTYAFNREQLMKQFDEMCSRYGFGKGNWPVVQQYIKGDGYGFFAFYDEGVCKASFMHRRIREYPVTGGASTCAISFYDEQLQTLGMRMLDSIGWNGVAMVEFKKSDADGTYYLMEINPKFWGSLELALTAGVNFPEMVIQKLNGEPVNGSMKPAKNVRFQWLLNGELFHFFERPGRFFSIFVDVFRSRSDFYFFDPLPNMVQVLMIFRYFRRKLTKAK